MQFIEGRTLHGFKLNRREEIDEIHATGLVFEHLKTGTQLLYLQREDDNKVFSITFRTPPPDSTGIPHILEHSVLCGSRKYPSKEPFVELAKGSMNTFLNAMTFPDKTMYPVASRNDQDFQNLMDVYLDAVFFPNIYRYPEIFMQEGWHHELESPDSQLEYRGVVYNEMKGVFSSPESMLFRKIPEALFPDTPYANESGGDPDVIPELTYETFINFHRTYYHPSNSFICMYGDGDVEEHLAYLDANYLGRFTRIDPDSGVPLQKPFGETSKLEAAYSILPHEEENDRTYLSLNFAIGTTVDPVLTLSFTILEHLLLETPAAPLKKALIDAGIGKDVFGHFEQDLQQPVLSIVAKNTNRETIDRFQKTVLGTLEELVSRGIDKRMIEASLNIHEFRLREADFRGMPRGLVYCWSALGSWLYGGDPFDNLAYESSLAVVRKALTTDYFEKLIREHVLDNPHRSLVTVYPEKGLVEKRNAQVREELQKYRDSLDRQRIEQLVRQTEKLKQRQETPDPPELVDKIPMLSLSDIDPKAEELPLEHREEQGRPVLWSPLFTSGITYLNLMFDTSSVERELIGYVPLLARILGRASTKNLDYAELSNELNLHTGGVHFGSEAYGDKDDDHLYRPMFLVRSKALTGKLPELKNLLGEMLANTLFDDPKRIREILHETISRFEMNLYNQGHLLAASRLISSFSPRGTYSELIGGISFFHFLRGLEKSFENDFDNIRENLRRTAETVFTRANLLAGVTAEEEHYRDFRDTYAGLLEQLPAGGAWKHATYKLEGGPGRVGLLTPGKVQYVARGHNFKRAGYQYTGALQVLRTVASLEYLWNRVRVQGGAYGCFARFTRNGTAYFCSYRDPNLTRTLEVYDQAGAWFSSFQASEREITKYVIGTVSRLDHPLTPSMKGEAVQQRYLQNLTQEDIQRNREEILATRSADLRNAADLITETMKQNHICVLGGQETLKEHSGLFDTLIDVF
jgi:hypothetical protein